MVCKTYKYSFVSPLEDSQPPHCALALVFKQWLMCMSKQVRLIYKLSAVYSFIWVHTVINEQNTAIIMEINTNDRPRGAPNKSSWSGHLSYRNCESFVNTLIVRSYWYFIWWIYWVGEYIAFLSVVTEQPTQTNSVLLRKSQTNFLEFTSACSL